MCHVCRSRVFVLEIAGTKVKQYYTGQSDISEGNSACDDNRSYEDDDDSDWCHPWEYGEARLSGAKANRLSRTKSWETSLLDKPNRPSASDSSGSISLTATPAVVTPLAVVRDINSRSHRPPRP